MKKPIQQIKANYRALRLEAQDQDVAVYSGQEPDTKQAVIIKVLTHLLGSDPQIVARFQKLAQDIRHLNHPNITSIHKVGQESGLPYVVTQALEKGHSLATRLDQAWAVDAAADVVMQVGLALDHAYRKGVIHGSLSPEKIVVLDDGRVQVSDLGLAEMERLVGTEIDKSVSPYVAPEQAAGKAPDAQGDVYALGAVLYNLLAKRNPQVVQGQVLPPSRFNSEIPPAMDAVVVRALASDPQKRYPNVGSFLAALGAVALGQVVKPRPSKGVTRCRECGAAGQTGRYCRKCGAHLEQAESSLDEPIQITKIEVGRVEVGKGVEMHPVVIAQPISVATGELSELFPQPLEMPEPLRASVWTAVADEEQDMDEQGPGIDTLLGITIPEPPPMPSIDWAEVAPPMPEVPVIAAVASSES